MGNKPRNSTNPSRSPTPDRVGALAAGLASLWPDARCELDHRNAFELLCATILAAQSTDKLVNTITPTLFARWPDAHALAAADPDELERMIHATGFFRMKARSLLGMARAVVERHGGDVPRDLDALVALPGVGRKTANVVRGAVWGLADGVVVDTHVTRLAQRLGLSRHTDPAKIEEDLVREVPRDQWISFADGLIWHGRRVCFARKPDCEHCALAPICPSAFRIGDARPVGGGRAGAAKKRGAKTSTSRPTVAVGAIVFDARGRVLLVKRGTPPAQGLWSVPGGRVELGETLAAAVEREVLEETGVRVACGALVEVVERITTEGDATWHYVILDYLAHAEPRAGLAHAEPGALAARHGDDAADARWFAIDELDAAPLTDGLLPVIDKARRAAGDLG